MLTEIEQQNLDIDWFFTSGENVGFIASGGGKIPNSVANEDENIELLSSYFRNLPEKTEISTNSNLSEILKTDVTEMYLADYVFMGKKGLYAFDKTVLGNFLDSNYHLVVKPIIPLKIYNLPLEIQQALLKTKYIGNIESESNIDVKNFT